MKRLIALYADHGTKLLGIAGLVVSSALLVPDLIPADHMKWWLFSNALLDGLTVRRGYTNVKATGQIK
jgi:hypothetical protein